MRNLISLRPVTNHDTGFLERLYSESRDWEFRGVNMPLEQKVTFLKQQFKAQDNAYKASFIKADNSIIQLKEADIGRLMTNRRDDALHIIDIALLSNYRGRGIGSDIICMLKKDAQDSNIPIELKVVQNNPAVNLYRRQDFQQTGLNGHHMSMRWSPH